MGIFIRIYCCANKFNRPQIAMNLLMSMISFHSIQFHDLHVCRLWASERFCGRTCTIDQIKTCNDLVPCVCAMHKHGIWRGAQNGMNGEVHCCLFVRCFMSIVLISHITSYQWQRWRRYRMLRNLNSHNSSHNDAKFLVLKINWHTHKQWNHNNCPLHTHRTFEMCKIFQHWLLLCTHYCFQSDEIDFHDWYMCLIIIINTPHTSGSIA